MHAHLREVSWRGSGVHGVRCASLINLPEFILVSHLRLQDVFEGVSHEDQLLALLVVEVTLFLPVSNTTRVIDSQSCLLA